MMHRKQYQLIADVIARNEFSHLPSGNNAIVSLANSLADEFEKDNPRFDRARFLTACGLHYD